MPGIGVSRARPQGTWRNAEILLGQCVTGINEFLEDVVEVYVSAYQGLLVVSETIGNGE